MRVMNRQHFTSDTGAWTASIMGWTGPKVVMIYSQILIGPVLLQAVTAVPSLPPKIPHWWCHKI